MFKLNKNSEFIIKDFQNSKSFASFLPGLVGEKGIPIWSFYVNRGQAMSSFGIENKDSAITEFFPADKSYQYTPHQAFRSFIKYKNNDGEGFIEPFSKNINNNNFNEEMKINANFIELTYEHTELELEFKVRYYVLPDAPVGGLVREVKLVNNNNESIDIELADGLASIFPAGIGNAHYKEMGNTLKSWFDVEKNEKLYNFYFLRGSTDDTEHIDEIKDGNFYSSLIVDNKGERTGEIIYDRELIFGNDETLKYPDSFLENSIAELKDRDQYSTNKISSGFTLWKGNIEKKDEVKIYSLIGYGESREVIKNYLESNLNLKTFNEKFELAQKIPGELIADVETKTANSKLNGYISQMYLDNGLRGGFPKLYSHENRQQIYYMYSRKHGDLERDYNFFSTSPTYYSQGNGNYRDINQNRRMDVIIHPEIQDYNISHFINLIQLDGYNPLEINKVTFDFNVKEFNLDKFIADDSDKTKMVTFFETEFEPGNLLHFMERKNIKLLTSFEEFLSFVLSNSQENLNSTHGEGYWIDHWTYNLDLIDSYLDVYPDQIYDLFFGRLYRYFRNKAYIKPRSQKYKYKKEKLGQYDALTNKETSTIETDWEKYKDGSMVETNLFAKLFLLTAIKTATIAPYGYGIEMEAGKPGWNDALNGLPGVFGASTSELYELKRLINLLKNIDLKNNKVKLPIELQPFIESLNSTINKYSSDLNNNETALKYWDEMTAALEEYRCTIYQGLSGEIYQFSNDKITDVLYSFDGVLTHSIQKVEEINDNGIIPTYFYFEIEQKEDEYSINFHDVAPFLEGNVKKMKLSDSTEVSKKLYDEIRASEIFDDKLRMYKTSVSIQDEPKELGRIKFFTRGWLENESIFLHMEYKYLLEILKAGLYDEFYSDIETMLIPFLDPKVYGRNILENSTFIASSANPDSATHGRGYVARLSGSTVEFMNMWKEMFIGPGPFKYDSKTDNLVFYLSPVLNSKLFKKDGTITFQLFSDIKVIYKNEKLSNTYGENRVVPTQYIITYKNGTIKTIDNIEIIGQTSKDIRNKLVESIVVQLM